MPRQDCAKGLGAPQHAAWQLAYCYKTGFGVRKDDAAADSWLAKSGKTRAHLEAEVLRMDQQQDPCDQPRLYRKMAVAGHIVATDLAEQYRATESLDRVATAYADEIADINRMLPVGRTIWLRLTHDLADIHRRLGHADEAEKLLREHLRESKSKFGDGHPCTTASMSSLALTYADRGRWEEAKKLQEEVMKTRKNAGSEASRHVDEHGQSCVDFAKPDAVEGGRRAAVACLEDEDGGVGSATSGDDVQHVGPCTDLPSDGKDCRS